MAPNNNRPLPPQNKSSFKRAVATVVIHAKKHVGVGIVCSVAYFDPGNWSVDLQAGSEFGYRLLFIVLMAGLGAVVLQILAAKLGCVTGLDLASHCRLMFNNHPKYPRLVRYGVLWPLYVLAELAIISTDLAELIGSAIGICLIIPAIPLWAGVLLTATDVLLILALGDPKKAHGRPVRIFEYLIIALVFVVFLCFIILIVKVKPFWPKAFQGYLPSKALVSPDGLYASIGILGATVMPHALFLGSFMATQDRVSDAPQLIVAPSTASDSRKARFKALFTTDKVNRDDCDKDYRTPYGLRENNQLPFIKAHLMHGIVDLTLSLLGFAVAINSAILILASAVFFYGPTRDTNAPAGLFDAHDLIRDRIGKPAAFIFAFALLSAGQSASITATLAGQIVSEGFIEWRVSPFMRRILTRLLGLIPSMAVAIAVGKEGIDSLLVISQVILSIVLPFVVFPLVYLTSSRVVMRVRKPTELIHEELDQKIQEDGIQEIPVLLSNGKIKGGSSAEKHIEAVVSREADTEEFIDYSNGWPMTILSSALWLVILIANLYLIITLAMGNE